MFNNRSRAQRLVLRRRSLLAVSVLTTAAVAVVLGLAVYLFILGHSGDSDPEGLTSLPSEAAVVILVVVGLPTALACTASWAGYLTAVRKTRELPR